MDIDAAPNTRRGRRPTITFLVNGLVAAGIGAWILLSRSTTEPTVVEPEIVVPAARVTLDGDGTMTVAIPGEAERPLGNLDVVEEAAQGAAQGAALNRLRVELERLSAAGGRDGSGRSDLLLDVVIESRQPWTRALWIAEIASSTTVRIHRLRFGLPGGSESFVPHDLDNDGRYPVVSYGMRATSILIVRVEVENEGAARGAPLATRVTMAWTCDVAEEERPFFDCETTAWKTSWATYGGVAALTREALGGVSGTPRSTLDIARPQRSRVSYGEVFTVLRALRDAGVASVRVHHRSTELPGSR